MQGSSPILWSSNEIEDDQKYFVYMFVCLWVCLYENDLFSSQIERNKMEIHVLPKDWFISLRGWREKRELTPSRESMSWPRSRARAHCTSSSYAAHVWRDGEDERDTRLICVSFNYYANYQPFKKRGHYMLILFVQYIYIYIYCAIGYLFNCISDLLNIKRRDTWA